MDERAGKAGRRTGWRSRPLAPAPPASADTSPEERLRRLLMIIPVAAQGDGATFADLASRLDVDEETVLGDVRQLIERSYKRTGAHSGDFQIDMGADGVRILTSGELRRPVRLSAREALALSLGLRLAALSPSAGDREARASLRARLDGWLAASCAATGQAPTEEVLPRFAAPDLMEDAAAVREEVSRALSAGRPCRIEYLKSSDAAPRARTVHPHRLVHGEGAWYVLAYCETAGTVRSFRLDRVLSATVLEGALHVKDSPGYEGFDASEHLAGWRVFGVEEADGEVAVLVRYSPRIARWLAEREEGSRDEDGGLLVRHRVADPTWLARHVLQYGGEAEVLEPPSSRELVKEAAAKVAERHGQNAARA